MDPVLSLKRPSSLDLTLCIFCQEQGGKLSKPGPQGMSTLTLATATRRKSKNDKFHDATDRLTELLNSDPIPPLTWHIKCYRPYTDSSKLTRLDELISSKSADDESPSTTPLQSLASTRRSSVAPINWELCMFCQKISKQRLSSVMTLEVSNSILADAKFDQKMSIHLSGINDLIAAEGKYHLGCLGYFRRSVEKTRCSTGTDLSDVPIEWLCTELKYAADKGHVLCLDDVWNRYMQIAEESNVVVPKSFVSRRANFTAKLRSKVEDDISFVVSEGSRSETRTLLLPTKYIGSVMSTCQSAVEAMDDDLLTIPPYLPEDDIFLSLVHVALKIHGDLMAKEGHKGLSVSEEVSTECVPDSLYIMFLNLLINGTSQLEDKEEEGDEEMGYGQNILSIAQDVVYAASGGKKWTPKHIGLASTLHQATRSKVLVDLFHKAGHTLSYKQVLQLDTALAKSTLESMDPQSGAVIPPNIIPGRFVHFTADNIDILDETLDGKNTFHATQMAAWQRGPSNEVHLDDIEPSSSQTLQVPDAIDALIPVTKSVEKTEPVLPEGITQDMVLEQPKSAAKCATEARATDLTFNILRQRGEVTSSWTIFNEQLSSQSQPVTSVGYMPIIQAPAHEYDTLNTVVNRCFQVSAQAGQEFTVLTVDQALYCKLMELKWAYPERYMNLIPRLGGLHISMNFLKVIGKHMEGSGLVEAWIEAGILGANTAQQAMDGKSYNKAMRAHKLTVQALWSLLGPSILQYVEATDKQLYDKISQANTQELIVLLSSQSFRGIMECFAEGRQQENVNFSYWWKYMDIVETLLMFTRAQRDGIGDLHLFSFREMLPYFLRYDHYNYGRWGPVYLAEMSQLPEAVKSEFQQGNFVVKGSSRMFNQVDPDQAQEWLNGTGKRGGGIIGITKTSSALSRWALSYNLRSHIALETRRMYHLSHTDRHCQNEEMPSRQEKDNTDEQSLVSVFQGFKVFDHTVQPTALQSIATKDLADEKIQDSLLNAKEYGKQQLEEFVKVRLVIDPGKSSPNKSLYDPITRNNASTFETLYEVKKAGSDKENTKIIKTDRNILQRLITAYAGGREVDLDRILKHELMTVPFALANLNGTIRSGNKAILADVITADVECPSSIDLNESTACLVIDGQARVISVGKPTDAKTFGDLADEFTMSIYNSGAHYRRIDVVFDRYRDESIKCTTRQRRSKTTRPIRRVIENRDVPLPSSWPNFISLPENKADLARFLSEQLIEHAPPGKEVVVAGGFENEQEVKCSHIATNLIPLRASHEEADTRLVLHAVNIPFDTVVVSAQDTDVLLLLVAHFHRVQCNHLWMMAGTRKKRKYIPVDAVHQKLPPGSANALLPFHALTGSDTTSYLFGHSKKTAWRVFTSHFELLNGLGEGSLDADKVSSAERFVSLMYGVDTASVDTARRILFEKATKHESLPPSSNSLQHHIQRVHFQSMVWKEAHCPTPDLPDPADMGWKRDDTGLQPILMTQNPIPDVCVELISCGCTTQCQSMRCRCRKAHIPCIGQCGCKKRELVCFNVRGN